MKKNCLALLFAFVVIINCNAQYVAVPDSNFGKFLSLNAPACISGNSSSGWLLDTIRADTASLYYFYLSNQNSNASNYQSLEGIQYFKNALYLDCSYTQLSLLPALPAMLQTLLCNNNQLTQLPVLPAHLNKLVCSYNPITALPSIPALLVQLDASYDSLITVTNLPPRINVLKLNNNPNLECLPYIPSGYLELIYTSGTAITCRPNYFQGDPNGMTWDQDILNFPLCNGSNGCEAATDIKAISAIKAFVYPNPTSGPINFEMQNLQIGSTIQIYNVTGERIYQSPVANGKNVVNLTGVNKGVYFYRVADSGGESIFTGISAVE